MKLQQTISHRSKQLKFLEEVQNLRNNNEEENGMNEETNSNQSSTNKKKTQISEKTRRISLQRFKLGPQLLHKKNNHNSSKNGMKIDSKNNNPQKKKKNSILLTKNGEEIELPLWLLQPNVESQYHKQVALVHTIDDVLQGYANITVLKPFNVLHEDYQHQKKAEFEEKAQQTANLKNEYFNPFYLNQTNTTDSTDSTQKVQNIKSFKNKYVSSAKKFEKYREKIARELRGNDKEILLTNAIHRRIRERFIHIAQTNRLRHIENRGKRLGYKKIRNPSFFNQNTKSTPILPAIRR